MAQLGGDSCFSKALDGSRNDVLSSIKCDSSTWSSSAKCSISSCRNAFNSNSLVVYHDLPQNPDLLKLWKVQCNILNNLSNIKICADHFFDEDYEFVYENGLDNEPMKVLKTSAIPRNFESSLKYNEIKCTVDENERLKQQIELLNKDKQDALEKLQTLSDKIVKKTKCIEQQYKKLKNFRHSKQQKNLLSRVFSDSQIGMLLGRKKVTWTDDDLAMAFTLRHMSNKECYIYLKDTLNLPLPALSLVQKWVAAKPK